MLAFIDTETTGLDPDRHEIWEVGLILRYEDGDESETTWQLPVDLGQADAMALKIGRFHDRRLLDSPATPLRTFANEFAEMTVGAHLVGAVVSFDEERLRRLLRAQGQCPMWHYHLIDVEVLVAGWLARDPDSMPVLPPWKSEDLSRLVGVDPDAFDRHSALGDAQWARAMYDAVMAP